MLPRRVEAHFDEHFLCMTRRSLRSDHPCRLQNCSPSSLPAKRKMLHRRMPMLFNDARQVSTI